MKHLTQDLTGKLLDAAVMLAIGGQFDPHRPQSEFQMMLPATPHANDEPPPRRRVLVGQQPQDRNRWAWSPSTDAAVGAPLLFKHSIATWAAGDGWCAAAPDDDAYNVAGRYIDLDFYDDSVHSGHTALIAGCRALVEHLLGAEVELS